MKKILLYASIFLLFISCKKEEIPPLPETNVYFPGHMTHGQATATKIDKEWQATAFAFFEEEDFLLLRFFTYSENNFLREWIDIYPLPQTKGVYDIKGSFIENSLGAGYQVLQDGGDIPSTRYDLDENAVDNFLEITAVDTVAKMIEGKFTVSFDKVENALADPDDPAKVKFSNGTFKVQIVE